MLADHDHDHMPAHVHEDVVAEFLGTEEHSPMEDAISEIRASVLEAAQANAGNPVGDVMTALGNRFSQAAQTAADKSGARREAFAKRAAEARMKGYEGDACGSCGNFTLLRNGTCMKCNTCGSTSGCS
jgi:ribonucleoside-diphosphate reductase alpha chain